MTFPLFPGVTDTSPKAFKRGTHRLYDPEQTLEKLRPLLPRMGITRVANVTGLDCIGVHVAQAVRPNSRSLSVAQGKGLTLPAAKASAVMESVENYHAERIALPLLFGSEVDLRSAHNLVDTTTISRPKKSAYHPDLSILWVEGYDLIRRETVWVPCEAVDTNYTYPQPMGSGCFAATTNGLASGNHLLEAIHHALCEVVERDAATVWGLAGREVRNHTCIDLDTVTDEGCRWVLDKFRDADVLVRAWEVTSDNGIPAFMCKIRDRGVLPAGPSDYPGYGCHPTRSIALLRALTEAAQGRLTFIAGSRDDAIRSAYEWREGPAAARVPELETSEGAPLRDFADGPNWDAATSAEDVTWVLERLVSTGIDRAIIVNLTKPEFNVPVVRAIVPGLELSIVAPGLYALGPRARRVMKNKKQ